MKMSEMIESIQQDIPDIDPEDNLLSIVDGGAATGGEWTAAYYHLLRILYQNRSKLSSRTLGYLKEDPYWNKLQKNESVWQKFIP